METEGRTKPVAVFMAFGTKGDVFPVAAVAAGFARDQRRYHVILVTHSSHECLSSNLAEKYVAYVPVSSTPILSTDQIQNTTGSAELSFSLRRKMLLRDHRQECYSIFEKIFEQGPCLEGDFIVINFFALEGWSLAELYRVRCMVAAPYVVPYSAPSTYERQFKKEHPLLYKYLEGAPTYKVCWKDVIHWMWPLFTEYWESWRRDLNLSSCPFTDPVTGLPEWHNRPSSSLLLYGFSKEVVEYPGIDFVKKFLNSLEPILVYYYDDFSCKKCREKLTLVSAGHLDKKNELCFAHVHLQRFLKPRVSEPLVFVGLSSVGSMGFLRDPLAFLRVLQTVLEITSYRIILFTAGYEPLNAASQAIAAERKDNIQLSDDGLSLFNGRLFCFSGTIAYSWLFPQCAAAIHHGGSGSTAAALQAGIPQVLCPFMHDQFYWAERMYWLGVAPEPLRRNDLFPETNDKKSIRAAANVLSRAINEALSPEVKARVAEIAEKLSVEDGVLEAVKCIKKELGCSDSDTPAAG